MEDKEKLQMYQQRLSGLFDSLFTKTISGTSIGPKELDQYNALIVKMTKLIVEIADQVALERVRKINNAVLSAFTSMEAEMDKRFSDLVRNEIVKKNPNTYR